MGDEGSERLDLINEVFAPYSHYFLMDVGLKPGMKIIEFGCGTGIMTAWIAKQVGPSGHVVAVDASSDQLEHAKRTATQQGLDNIEFIHATAETFNSADSLFDFAYSKLLLMHLKDPLFVLQKLKSLLKPKCVLACEEPTVSSLLTYPHNAVIEKMNEYFIQLGEARGMDFNIGDKLPEIFTNLSFSLIRPRFIQPIISMQAAKKFLSLAAREAFDAMVKEGIISQENPDRILKLLRDIPEDNSAYYAFPRHIQISGIKN